MAAASLPLGQLLAFVAAISSAGLFSLASAEVLEALQFDTLHYGVNLFLGKDKTLKIRARINDNHTALVPKFMSQHGINDPAGYGQVINMLGDAGGARCDACKTMTESLQTYFRAMSQKMRPQGDVAGVPSDKRVEVGLDSQAKLVADVCHGEGFADFSPKVKEYCEGQLGSQNRRAILRRFEGKPLEANKVPERKLDLCVNLLQECPKRKANPVPISPCQACMETFQTLDFLMRRDDPHIRMISQDALALKKSKKAKDDGFASPIHAEARLEELCSELHLHFTGAALEAVTEACDEITGEYASEVKRAFSVLGKGAEYGIPTYTVCANTVKACKAKEFDDNFPFLLNFHANVTNIRPSTRQAFLQAKARHGAEL